MDKYIAYSIAHLQLYLEKMQERKENNGIVYWEELKEVLPLCSVENLKKCQN